MYFRKKASVRFQKAKRNSRKHKEKDLYSICGIQVFYHKTIKNTPEKMFMKKKVYEKHIGATRFELATSRSRTVRSTKLSHAPYKSHYNTS